MVNIKISLSEEHVKRLGEMGYVIEDLDNEVTSLVREYIRMKYSDQDSVVEEALDTKIKIINNESDNLCICTITSNVVSSGQLSIGYALAKNINRLGIKPYTINYGGYSIYTRMVHKKDGDRYSKIIKIPRINTGFKKKLIYYDYVSVSLRGDNETIDIMPIANIEEYVNERLKV